MTELELRHVSFDACFNFRDLGGYPTRDGRAVRWRTLYRSDTLHRLTAEDARVFAALGLRTVIDLRSASELDECGRLRSDAGDVEWHHSPMLDNVALRPSALDEAPRPPALAPDEHYFLILEQFSESFGETFNILSSDGALPAVFHCTGGRDRTGMVAALMLEILGVEDKVIAGDYLLTEKAGERTMAWVEANEPDFAALVALIPPETRQLRSEVILGFLGRVRAKYGSAAGFLSSVGVSQDHQEALRRGLLSDAVTPGR